MSSFPTTSWTEIAAAGLAETEEGRLALGRLVQRYQPALIAYISKKFTARDERHSQDLFQRFVADLIINKAILCHAHPMQGRQFRSFLLTALHNFCVSELRRENSAQRRPAGGFQSLDELRARDDFLPASLPPANFDLEWARGVLLRAVEEMRDQCFKEGLEHVWRTFEARLLEPLLHGSPELSYPELVRKLHFASPTQAHNALVTAKRKFATALRRVIAQYASGEDAIETELQELQTILALGSGK